MNWVLETIGKRDKDVRYYENLRTHKLKYIKSEISRSKNDKKYYVYIRYYKCVICNIIICADLTTNHLDPAKNYFYIYTYSGQIPNSCKNEIMMKACK